MIRAITTPIWRVIRSRTGEVMVLLTTGGIVPTEQLNL